MGYIYGYSGEFERSNILAKIGELESRMMDEKAKDKDERSPDKEFELLYARMIAGLKLNTGYRLY